jgi:dienelactone hydrolase
MNTTASLRIAGSGGEPVPNAFLRQRGETAHVGVLLPGFAYTAEMPLFYYAERLLLAAGADVLRVDYRYHQRPGARDLPEQEQDRRLLADARAALDAALAQRPYREITLVGKSLGTLAMAHLLAGEPAAERVRAVWLTPLLRVAAVREQIQRLARVSLLAIGTADPHHDPGLLDQVRAAGCEVVVVEGANHGFDVPGDAAASVRAVEQVVLALGTFLARERPVVP